MWHKTFHSFLSFTCTTEPSFHNICGSKHSIHFYLSLVPQKNLASATYVTEYVPFIFFHSCPPQNLSSVAYMVQNIPSIFLFPCTKKQPSFNQKAYVSHICDTYMTHQICVTKYSSQNIHFVTKRH